MSQRLKEFDYWGSIRVEGKKIGWEHHKVSRYPDRTGNRYWIDEQGDLVQADYGGALSRRESEPMKAKAGFSR